VGEIICDGRLTERPAVGIFPRDEKKAFDEGSVNERTSHIPSEFHMGPP